MEVDGASLDGDDLDGHGMGVRVDGVAIRRLREATKGL